VAPLTSPEAPCIHQGDLNLRFTLIAPLVYVFAEFCQPQIAPFANWVAEAGPPFKKKLRATHSVARSSTSIQTGSQFGRIEMFFGFVILKFAVHFAEVAQRNPPAVFVSAALISNASSSDSPPFQVPISVPVPVP
jgi:hypothetical protein